MRSTHASLLAAFLILAPGCAVLEGIFTRQTVEETVLVPVYENTPVLDENGVIVLNEDGTAKVTQEIVGYQEITKTKVIGPAPAEEIVQVAGPLAGPWAFIAGPVIGILAGWVTRGKQEDKTQKKVETALAAVSTQPAKVLT